MGNDREKKRNFILKILEKVFNFLLKLGGKKKKDEKDNDKKDYDELYSSDELGTG
tara:strand:- start:1052 stop:1216 length:165 start_codon:yes stop_codon:yes gene_type:complete